MHKNKKAPEITYEQTEVARNTIENTLSGTGTLEPVKSTSITSSVQGEILSADFEEGDEAKKGQVLYKISTENLDESIADATETVERAQRNYEHYAGFRDRKDKRNWNQEIHGSQVL